MGKIEKLRAIIRMARLKKNNVDELHRYMRYNNIEIKAYRALTAEYKAIHQVEIERPKKSKLRLLTKYDDEYYNDVNSWDIIDRSTDL